MDRTGELGVMAGILVPIAMFAMIFGIVYLYKRERMAMIERGMDPRRYKAQSAPYQNLKWGLLLMGAGMGLFIALLFDKFVFRELADNDNPAIYFAMIAMFGGGGLYAAYLIEKKNNDKEKDNDKAE